MRYHVSIGEHAHTVEVTGEGVRLDGRLVRAELSSTGAGAHSLLLDGASHRLLARRTGAGAWKLQLDGRGYRAEVVDDRTRAIRALTGQDAKASGPRPLKAPMPGLVVKVEVEPGDSVARGQGLVIVEAMKMENELRAETEGVVKVVHTQPGQTIEKDQVLMEFESFPQGQP
jgi:pyruvate carboxylase subunit B